MKREFTVGLVLLLLVGGLVALTLYIEDPRFMGDRVRVPMTARFREVPGLSKGSKVWIYGTEAGEVVSITPDGKGSVEVQLDLDFDPELHENATVQLRSSSALGRAVVSIHPGTPDTPRMPPRIVDGVIGGDALSEAGRLVSEIRGPMKETVANLQKVTTDLAARSEQMIDNLDAFSQNARDISDELRSGKGTVGKLMNDDTLYNELEAAVASLKRLGDDASTGGGTLDMLLHDQQMADDLRTTMASLREVSGRLERGEGSLGKLLSDPSLYDNLAATTADLQTITASAREGHGVLGRLLYDEELGDRLDRISADVSQVTGKLRRGEGTLGRLIQDDDLYEELRDSLRSLTAGAGDARENAPILVFASFLFGGF